MTFDPNAIGVELAEEFRRLGQTHPSDEAQPVAMFSARPWEAYTLVATLQGTARNPSLSDVQRDIVLGFAHQVGDQLIAMARALIGPDSMIERTTNMGFDPNFDIRVDDESDVDDEYDEDDGEPCLVCGCTDDRACPGGCAWIAPRLCSTVDEAHERYRRENRIEGDSRSHMVAGQLVRYVDPTWIRLATDEETDELRKCACCARFFLQSTAVQMFQELDQAKRIVLGYELCAECAPKVLEAMQ